MADPEPLPLAVSFDDAARLLSCSVDTIRDLVNRGELHKVKVRSLARISVDELRAYIAAGGTSPNEGYGTTSEPVEASA